MAVYDYEEQLKKYVKIANTPDLNAYDYERVLNTSGKTPDPSIQYYTKNGVSSYTKCEIPLASFNPRVNYYVMVKNPITYRNVARFNQIINNPKYIEGFAKYVYKDSLGEIINRHVFKFTRLREDIIFIKGRLRKPGSSVPGKPFCIVVNEKSFWNRLRFFKADNQTSTFRPSDGVDPYDLLLGAIRHSSAISSIKFKLAANESEEITNFINRYNSSATTTNELLSYNVVDNANFEINGFEHFSKRLWIAYFEAFYNNGITLADKNKLDAIDYKSSTSIGFYNPDEEGFERYKLFYQGQ